MKVRELLSYWEQNARSELTREAFMVRLPLEDAARLQALARMYPRRSLEELITDLLSAALEELESTLPYVEGDRVVALDEQGDPMYEDVGPTPRYLSLMREQLARYRKTMDDPH